MIFLTEKEKPSLNLKKNLKRNLKFEEKRMRRDLTPDVRLMTSGQNRGPNEDKGCTLTLGRQPQVLIRTEGHRLAGYEHLRSGAWL